MSFALNVANRGLLYLNDSSIDYKRREIPKAYPDKKPWFWRAYAFFFFASAYDNGWAVLSLATRSSTDSAKPESHFITESARGRSGASILKLTSPLAGIGTPTPQHALH